MELLVARMIVPLHSQGILSSNENFLLFGANCAENCFSPASAKFTV